MNELFKKEYTEAEERLYKKGYRLSLYAEYDNDFLYFVSLYESKHDAMRKLENFSCNTWK